MLRPDGVGTREFAASRQSTPDFLPKYSDREEAMVSNSPQPEPPCFLLVTTCADADSAMQLARQLIRSRQAACVNLLPGARSIYAWQGQIEETDEVVLLVKTSTSDPDTAIQAVAALHPYEVPEVLCFPIEFGLAKYLDWVRAGTTLQSDQ